MAHMIVSSVLAASHTGYYSGLAGPSTPAYFFSFLFYRTDLLLLDISIMLRAWRSELPLALFLIHLHWLCVLHQDWHCVFSIWSLCGTLPQ